MKKGTIIALIISAVLILLGILMCAASYPQLEMLADREEHYRTETYTYDINEINKIRIDDIDSCITVVSTSEPIISMEWNESDRNYYNINVSDRGEFIAERRTDYKWYDFESMFDLFSGYDTVYVKVYEGYTGDIELGTINGSISISVDESTVSGPMWYREIDDRHVMLTNDDARFTFGSVDIHSVNGEIYLYNTVVNDSAVLETTNGDITLANVAPRHIYVGTTNGEIDVYDLDLISLAARLPLIDSYAEYSKFSTVNGDIDMMLRGDMYDYIFDIFTVNGDVENGRPNVKDANSNASDTSKHEAQVPLTVSTVNGDIEIDYLG